jgi:hypothetical protein
VEDVVDHAVPHEQIEALILKRIPVLVDAQSVRDEHRADYAKPDGAGDEDLQKPVCQTGFRPTRSR